MLGVIFIYIQLRIIFLLSSDLKGLHECESNPCVNYGRCEDLYDGYRCKCTADFTGINCEISM